jgi:hypothetical protein
MSIDQAASGRQADAGAPGRQSKPVALVELIATLALALCTLIAVTAVSIGIARADVFGAQTDGSGESLAVALFVGLMLSAMACLTAVMAEDQGVPHD